MNERSRVRLQHTIYFVGGIALAIIIFSLDGIRDRLGDLGGMRYLGSLIAGLFYSTSFGSPSATVALFEFGKQSGIIIMAILGGIGSLFYDYLIYRFARDRFTNFLSRIFHKDFGDFFEQRTWMSRLIILIGIIFLGSPLPDEIGSSLLGLSRMRRRTFLMFSFILNTIGIFIILLLGRAAS